MRRVELVALAGAVLMSGLVLAGCGKQSARAAGSRVIVLGVDGMDPQFLESHWNVLPNLNRLRQKGDFKPLATSTPPQSPVAWTSFMTGMDPGGHGIFDFIHRDPATRMVFSSMAEVSEPSNTLSIGPYVIPLSGGGARALRQGKVFWQYLTEHSVPATIVRMPANFPPADCEAESLAGMGTPDLSGSFGTFSYYTDDPAETRTKVPGGKILHVEVSNGRVVLPLEGPVNSLRKDRPVTSVSLVVYPDPTEAVARFELDNQQFVLKQREWSDWIHAEFSLIRGLTSAKGMFRVYLQQVHPRLRIYVSPVNIDPANPQLPISTPASFSRQLAEALGPFYTQGIAEEASALRAGVFTRDEFLTQSHQILQDSLRMFRYELKRFDSGLLFFYFSSVDQNSHMLWGKYDRDLVEIYRAIDEAVGEAMRVAADDTTLIVMSDHGFAPFDRAVHLNTWLMREGFLTLDDPSKTGDGALFPHVDWSRTQAYAVGLNAIYLNLAGREPGGAVSEADRQVVLERLTQRLLNFRDPKTGNPVVGKVYLPQTAYRGKNLKYAPDLLVGFHRGYRASWQTALGAVPGATIEDNTQAWIGDHCMASDEVPGVFLSNRHSRIADPQLYDLTVTILHEFGVPRGEGMIGKVVF